MYPRFHRGIVQQYRADDTNRVKRWGEFPETTCTNAVPFRQRGDALEQVVVGGRHLEDAPHRMGVGIDEAWSNNEAIGVDHAARDRGRQIADARDPVATPADVGDAPTGCRCRRRYARPG